MGSEKRWKESRAPWIEEVKRARYEQRFAKVPSVFTPEEKSEREKQVDVVAQERFEIMNVDKNIRVSGGSDSSVVFTWTGNILHYLNRAIFQMVGRMENHWNHGYN